MRLKSIPVPFNDQTLANFYNLEELKKKAELIFSKTIQNQGHFVFQTEKLTKLSKELIQLFKKNHLNNEVPLHARSQHLILNGINLMDQVKLESDDKNLNCWLDLIFVSVLVDAGAGQAWNYVDPNDKKTYSRSVGLALSCFYAFKKGIFSHDSSNLWQVSSQGLKNLKLKTFENSFQHHPETNPLLKIETRWQLLQGLAEILDKNKVQRPSELLKKLADIDKKKIFCKSYFENFLKIFAGLWKDGFQYGDYYLGDTWYYPAFGRKEDPSSYISFHKLAQWLILSVLDIFGKFNYQLHEIDIFTPLAEYRNGGLLLDAEVLKAKEVQILKMPLELHDPIIIEWRALTVAIIEKLRILVNENLGKRSLNMPQLLQLGTWELGRQYAKKRDPIDLSPPLNIQTEGSFL